MYNNVGYLGLVSFPLSVRTKDISALVCSYMLALLIMAALAAAGPDNNCCCWPVVEGLRRMFGAHTMDRLASSILVSRTYSLVENICND
ncbi:hypothetical protein DERF_004887 [Dermatophagoides farinae]|uniref:Uncharacterized protein n=1 Tax=Dermatophagoides farinae TaxID=6954 RepID=A0A922L610_DERFA|nr:hypothetical protein DERF_004887 [Dermatophagoides farinae]